MVDSEPERSVRVVPKTYRDMQRQLDSIEKNNEPARATQEFQIGYISWEEEA